MIHIYTHNRNFHSDELMAIALLIKYHIQGESYNIIRTRDENILQTAKEDKNCFVIDVGFSYDSSFLNFDHHQNNDLLSWEDGSPLSSCGLVWKWLRENKKLHQHMNSQMMDSLEKDLIKPIDMHDNGLEEWGPAEIFSSYNRKTEKDDLIDKKFNQALQAIMQYLDNFIYSLKIKKSDEKSIKKAIKQSEEYDGIVISDCGIDSGVEWVSKLTDKKIFIYPRTRNSWIIKIVHCSNSKINKVNFPDSWLGQSSQDLKKISGLNNLIFCHKSGHMCIIDGTKENALSFARYIIDKP